MPAIGNVRDDYIHLTTCQQLTNSLAISRIGREQADLNLMGLNQPQ